MRQVELSLAQAYGVDLAKVQRHAEAGMKFAKLAGAGDDLYNFLIGHCVLNVSLRNNIFPGHSSCWPNERKNPQFRWNCGWQICQATLTPSFW